MAGCPFCEVVTHKRIVKLLNLTIISNYCIVIYAVTTLRFGCDLVDNIWLCSPLCALQGTVFYAALEPFFFALSALLPYM